MAELESFSEKGKPKKAEGEQAPVVLEPQSPPTNLESADYEPLLQATASRALSTCLGGARGLALLADPRAFGLLLQLSREDAAETRAEVCRALAALDDPRSVKRLRSMLFDDQPNVRDAAFSALAMIHKEAPLDAADAGLSGGFEDVRRRGLQVLVDVLKKEKADRR